MNDAAIHRVSGEVFDLSLRLLVHSGSPRAFSPRDDKRDCADRLLFHSGSPRPQGARDDKTLCHCEEGAGVTDAAIHWL